MCPFRKIGSRPKRLKKTDTFAVREAPPILILLAILAPPSFTASINYEILEPVDTFRSYRYREDDGSDRYTVHENNAGNYIDNDYEHCYGDGKANKGHHDLDKRYTYYDD